MKSSIVLMLLILCVSLVGCGPENMVLEKPEPSETYSSVSNGIPLICLADSEEEAMEIADLYGIELVSYDYGIAGFSAEENPRDVIARGEKNGWPQLSLNHIYKTS